MGCQILKSLTSKSMPSVVVASMAMGPIRISGVEPVTGKVFERYWRINERRRDAGATESRCREYSGLFR